MTPNAYDSLIDAATWAFIRRTESFYPPDTTNLSITEQRAVYDRMCEAFRQGRPAEIRTTDLKIAGVPCRRYHGAHPQIIYFHGGGFVVGGLHSHDDICAELCQQTGLDVVSVDYRLLPEHAHPAAFADALAVTTELANSGPVLLVGDSAGANLAAAVSAACRGNDRQRILGQILVYPGLSNGFMSQSFRIHAHAPMLTLDDVRFYASLRQGAGGSDDPTLFPLLDTSFADLPPTLAIAAECDPLADDATDYAAAVTAAGGRAIAIVEPGLVHGYLRARTSVPRAAQSFARIVSAVKDMASGHWPLKDLS